MNMYDSSVKYRDACESGKIIYSSFYRTLLMLSKVQLKEIDINKYMKDNSISKFILYGCNDITVLFAELCEKWGRFPEYITDTRPYRFQNLVKNKIVLPDTVKTYNDVDMIIVMSNYNFNEIAVKLHSFGIDYNNIISIEEFLANILCQKWSEQCDEECGNSNVLFKS